MNTSIPNNSISEINGITKEIKLPIYITTPMTTIEIYSNTNQKKYCENLLKMYNDCTLNNYPNIDCNKIKKIFDHFEC